MTKHEEREVMTVDAATIGGKGLYYRERLIDGPELGDYITTYAKLTVTPGCHMAEHQHVGDAETYYILSGNGTYTANGETCECGPGDVFFCPDGGWHAIANTGKENLEFIALIVKTS